MKGPLTMTVTKTNYGFGVPVSWNYQEAIERVTAALKDEGFGVLTSIDVQKTLKEKIDVDTDPYVILGACNPNLARAALEGRSDDTEDVIRRRLALYHEVTHPIVEWYSSRGILVSVDAMRPVDRVARQILTALEAMRPLVDLVPESARKSVDLTGLGVAFGDS